MLYVTNAKTINTYLGILALRLRGRKDIEKQNSSCVNAHNASHKHVISSFGYVFVGGGRHWKRR
jgi:hypothetical protein